VVNCIESHFGERRRMTGLRIGVNAHLLSFMPGYRRAGVSQYIEQIVRGLAALAPEHGDTLTVFAEPTPPPPGYVSPAVCWRRSRLPTGHAPGRILWEQAVAPFAVPHAHLDVLLCPVNVVPLAVAVPTVVTVHDLAFLAHPEAFVPAKRRYLAAMTRLSTHRARRVIAVSAHTAADLTRYFNVPPAKITVIPNAADPAFRPAANPADIAAFRQSMGLPERFVLAVGTLEPRKNLRRLVDAFARIAPQAPEVSLVIVGGAGWRTSDLAPHVASLGLGERIRFAGYVENGDLPRWYQAATVFCYPSLYEGFGLPPLEAMACGTAVVTSNTSSLPEVVGDAALTVDPTDTPAIAAALLYLLTDDALRATLAAAGLAQATQFRWARTAAETRAVLADAAKGNRRGTPKDDA